MESYPRSRESSQLAGPGIAWSSTSGQPGEAEMVSIRNFRLCGTQVSEQGKLELPLNLVGVGVLSVELVVGGDVIADVAQRSNLYRDTELLQAFALDRFGEIFAGGPSAARQGIPGTDIISVGYGQQTPIAEDDCSGRVADVFHW